MQESQFSYWNHGFGDISTGFIILFPMFRKSSCHCVALNFGPGFSVLLREQGSSSFRAEVCTLLQVNSIVLSSIMKIKGHKFETQFIL